MTKGNRDGRESSTLGHRFLPMHDPEVLEVRSGGGCISVFGLPFLLAGIFLMQIPLGLIPVKNAESISWLFFILFGGVFAVVGACMVFGRSGLIIDRRRKLIIRWRGLMLPMKREEQFLDNVKRVSLNKHSGGGDSATSYSVKLEGDTMKAVDVLSPTNYQEARQRAEEIARFLSRPLADSSAGVKIVREPERLDESLRERLWRMKEGTSYLPPRPLSMKTRIEEMGEGVVLEIPGEASAALKWMKVGMFLVFAAIGLYFFVPISRLPAPPAVRYFFLGFFLIFFILGPLGSFLRHGLRGKRRSTLVTVTPSLLRVEERVGREIKVTEIPAQELEELELPTRKSMADSIEIPDKFRKYDLPDTGIPRLPDGRPMPRILVSVMKLIRSPGIMARSDAAWVQFGCGLPEDELVYLHALIRKIVG